MSYRRQPDSSLALLWLVLLCAVLLLLGATQKAHGQIGNASAPPSLSGNLEQAEMNLQQLMGRLGERQKQIADLQSSLQTADARLLDLQASLATLQGQLVLAQESLANSQTELQETLLSLDSLSLQYGKLEESWQAYRGEMQTQVRAVEREARRAKVFVGVFAVGALAGAIGCLILALR